MVWYRYKKKRRGLTNRKDIPEFIKKFKGDNPDLDYFGSGMLANYLYLPEQVETKAFELFPTLKDTSSSLAHIVTNAPRSFEICKELGTNTIRLVIRSIKEDMDSYAKSLDAEHLDTGLKILPLTKQESAPNYKTHFFDFELTNQFNFTTLESKQEPIINKLLRVIESYTNCGIMIQFLFTRSIDWNDIAELTASNLSRYLKSVEKDKTKQSITGFGSNLVPLLSPEPSQKIDELSSSTYQLGKKLESSYHQKANSPPITLAIRGMIIGSKDDIKAAMRNMLAVLTSVRFIGDSLSYFDYEVEYNLGLDWLENNSMKTEYAYQILQNNVNMWADMRWGEGRDFVPFLCLSPEEFSVFVSLPTDPNLAVSYRRQKVKGLNYDKMVFPLGKIL